MNAENIAENMKSLGFGANARTEVTNPETSEVKTCNRVYFKTGSKHITAYLDLDGESPRLQVSAFHPEGYSKLTGDDLKALKSQRVAMTREALRPAAMAAYVAEKYGADLAELADSFGLRNKNEYLKPYTPNEPGEDGQEATQQQKNPPSMKA